MPKPVTTLPETQIIPNPALEKRTRRRFSADYKLRIITEANACKHGEVGALLRREKLYHNQLSQWRREYAEQGFSGLSKSEPGPAPSKTPKERQNEQLRKQITGLKRKLEIANDCLELQKKVLLMVERLNRGNAA